MYSFEIKSLKFKNSDPIEANKINVIIGPNNCGKSTTLNEIYELIIGNYDNKKIVDNIIFDRPTSKDSFFNSYDINNLIFKINNNYHLKCFNSNDPNNTRVSIPNNWEYIINSYIDNNTNEREFLHTFGYLFTILLKTESRLTLIKEAQTYGPEDYQTNYISEIEFSSESSKQLKDMTKKLFGRDVVYDKDSLRSKTLFRTSGDSLDYYRYSKLFDTDVIKKLSKEEKLDFEGDGLKSFVSIFTSLNKSYNNVVLIDEPESFMHPPLARKLGELLTEIDYSKKQLFITTHSPELLKGLMIRPDMINIIRIERNAQNNYVTLLNNKDLKKILEDPLLSSSRILEGLFCEKTILTESDSDEIFYQQVATKINSYNGMYFTHGQNKQTLAKIAQIYDKLNVKNCAIYDFDLLRNNDDFNSVIKNKVNDEKMIQSLQQTRKKIQSYYDCKANQELDKHLKKNPNTNKDEQKQILKTYKNSFYWASGIRKLPPNLNKEASNLISKLEEYGIFVIRYGCLETWFDTSYLSYTTNKTKWFKDALQLIYRRNINELKTTKPFMFIRKISKY